MTNLFTIKHLNAKLMRVLVALDLDVKLFGCYYPFTH